MSTRIYLWAGPGSGKSTLAADLFATGKRHGRSVELVREYAKELVWQGQPLNQLDLWAEQWRRERILDGKVDYVVTDSPWPLGAAYAEFYGAEPWLYQAIQQAAEHERKYRAGKIIDIFVRRTKAYETAGRNEDEVTARQLDSFIFHYASRLAGGTMLTVDSSTPAHYVWSRIDEVLK